MSGEPEPLNAQQERYVSFVLTGLGETQAALKAGYGRAYSRKARSKISANPAVKAAIDAGQARLREKSGYNAETAVVEINAQIKGALNAKSPNHMAAAKLVELKCKIFGLVREKIEVVSVDLLKALSLAEARVLTLTPGSLGSIDWRPHHIAGNPVAEHSEVGAADGQDRT